MPVSVTHQFVSAKPDGGDSSLVKPSDWNATHTISGLGTAAEYNVGTSGGNVPLLNGANTWSAAQTFDGGNFRWDAASNGYNVLFNRVGGTAAFNIPTTFDFGATVIDLTVRGVSDAYLSFTEMDQVDPAGRFRFAASGNSLILQKSTSASWNSSSAIFTVPHGTAVLDFANTPTVGGSALALANLSNISAAGEVIVHSATRTAAAAATIPAGVDAIRTTGYATVGDGGAALFKRVGSEPSHVGKFQSADGAWWELVPVDGVVYAEAAGFSATASGSDNATVLNSLLGAFDIVSVATIATFPLNSTIVIPADKELRGRPEAKTKPKLQWSTGTTPNSGTYPARMAINLTGARARLRGWHIEMTTDGDFRRTVSMGGNALDEQVVEDNKITLALTGVDGAQVHFVVFGGSNDPYYFASISRNEITGTCNRPMEGVQVTNMRKARIVGNYIHDIVATGQDSHYWGIYCSQKCYETEVSHNYIDGNPNGSGIHLANFGDGVANDYGRRVNHNTVRNVTHFCLSLDNVNGVHAEGNIVSGADIPFVLTGSQYCRVMGGSVDTAVAASPPNSVDQPLMSIGLGAGGHVISDVLFGAAGAALNSIVCTEPDVTIEGCVFLSTGPGKTIAITGARGRVVGCSLHGTTGSGRRISLAADGVAVGNTITQNTGQNGVTLAGANGLAVGNRVTGGTSGVWMTSTSSACIAAENIITGTSGAAIQNDGATSNVWTTTGQNSQQSVTLSAGATSIALTGVSRYKTANTGATSISTLSGGVEGSVFFIHANDANTTLVHGNPATPSGLLLRSGQNRTLARYDVVGFLVIDSDCAVEIGGFNLGTAAEFDTGTSGATIPLLNGVNTWSGAQTFSAGADFASLPTVASASLISSLSYTQSGTGGVARSVSSYIADVLHVADYGAVCDGTTDDAAAIQNAVNAANSQGKALRLGKRHRVNSTIDLPAGFYLYGAPGRTVMTVGITNGSPVLRWADTVSEQFFGASDIDLVAATSAQPSVVPTSTSDWTLQNAIGIKAGVSGSSYGANRTVLENIRIHGLQTAIDWFGWVGDWRGVLIQGCGTGLIGNNINGVRLNIQIENTQKSVELTDCGGIDFGGFMDEGYGWFAGTLDDCRVIDLSGAYFENSRTSTTLGASPLATQSGLATITVTHTSHGIANGATVLISDATDVNGITAAQINGERVITVINANSYSFSSTGTASSTGSGGGSSVKIARMRTTPFLIFGGTTECQAIKIGSCTIAQNANVGVPALKFDRVDGLEIGATYGSIWQYRKLFELTSNCKNVWLGAIKHDTGAADNGQPWFTDASGQVGTDWNYMANPRFDLWFRGWDTVAATNATLSQETTIVRKGPNALKVLATAATTQSRVTFTITDAQLVAEMKGRTVRMGAWVYVPSSEIRNDYRPVTVVLPGPVLQSFNGSVTTTSNARNGRAIGTAAGEWQFWWVEHAIQSDATQVIVRLQANHSNNNAAGTEFIIIDEVSLCLATTPMWKQMQGLCPVHPYAGQAVAGRMHTRGSAAPTSTVMSYAVGDIQWNSAPTTTTAPGWICTTAGSPGTWTALLTSLTTPQFTSIDLGGVTDTTVTRSAAGVMAVEGIDVCTVSGTQNLTNKTFTAGVNVTGLVDITNDKLRLRTAKTPASATDTGNAGDICWDASYLYVCTATNTWRRITHGSW